MQVFKSTLSGQNITVDNMEKAEKVIIGISQSQTFFEELVNDVIMHTKSWWMTQLHLEGLKC